MTSSRQNLILIGAARSGTKLVRDLIAAHPDVAKVPYDITYIWRLGNEDVPHDELPVELLTPQIKRRIQRRIDAFRSGAPQIIEKTVENCLRVLYVYAVFPDAFFLHLVRDGRDVVESAYRQWTAPPDWGHIIRKASTFPLGEAFGYAYSYAGNSFRRLMARNIASTSITWGPRYEGIDEDKACKELLEVCAIQWARSVEKALSGLRSLPSDQVFTIHYEQFVQSPHDHLKHIAQFVGIDPSPYSLLPYVEMVSQRNIGKGFRSLNETQKDLALPYIQDTLALLGYL